ncbi:cytoskeleton protein RodZ [Nitrosomonas aestuarii]|uniref:Cytoskeleton protein RodZ n=1 Tax=Nitrosomonas aestuarii TaxID=52441 RepID=A0A1I4F4H7_9PROT|nr:helix-turn-helix domain-containing protein [Nitrosomonas aestuarii]SFL12353.1 cytoskeleton protein RodZ [Nitrosomonas aestuarii]
MNDHMDNSKNKQSGDGNQEDAVTEQSERNNKVGIGSGSVAPEAVRDRIQNLHKFDNAADDYAARRTAVETEPEISRFLKTEGHSEAYKDETLNSASVVQGVGHMLRNARIAKNMSVDDISRQLRISIHQVESIEKENFEELPGRTFVRGFVRNYANLMQLDAAAIVKLLPGPTTVVANVEHTPFKVQEMTSSSRDGKKLNSTLFIIIIMIFLTLTGYFLYEKMPFWQQTEQSTDLVIQQENGQTAVELQLPLPSLKLSEKPNEVSQFKQNSLTSMGAVSAINTFGTLTFNFSADAHVKVTDGNNDIVFEQNNTQGTQQRVSGKKPLSVVISDASAVEVTYNDRQIDIKPYTNTQNGSAQLMLE